jgi:pimeloyl-ACP methyl ester carboxylesterase
MEYDGARVRAPSTCFADPSRVSAARMAESVEEVRSRDHLPYASDAFLRTLRGLLRTFIDVGPNRPWKLAERVTCPTLVVYGRKDPLVDPRSAHRVTKHFPDAHVVVLPDSGHVAQMEHPEFVAAAWDRFIR